MENLSVLVLDQDPVSLWTISNMLARFNFKGAHFNSQASPFRIFPFLSKKEVVFRGRMKDSRYIIWIWYNFAQDFAYSWGDYKRHDLMSVGVFYPHRHIWSNFGYFIFLLFGGKFGCTAVWLEVWVYGCLAGSLGVRPLGVKFGCTVVWWEYLYVLSIMIWTTN